MRQRQPVAPTRAVWTHRVLPIAPDRRRRRGHLLEQPRRALHLGRSDLDRHQPDDSAPVAALGSAAAAARNAGRRAADREPVVRDQLRDRRPVGGRLPRRKHRRAHRLCAAAVRHRAAHAGAAWARASADSTALAAALLWMLHPLQSEAVDYITQRSESLMALFFLLTLYCAIRARQTPAPSRPASAGPLRRRRIRRPGALADAFRRRVRVRHGVEGIDGGGTADRGAVRPRVRVPVDPRGDPGAGIFLRRAGGDLDRARRVPLAAAAIDRRTVYRGRPLDLPAESEPDARRLSAAERVAGPADSRLRTAPRARDPRCACRRRWSSCC